MIPIVTKAVEVRGVILPWERKTRAWIEVPPDTVIESGEVFIPLCTLTQLAEQDVYDSQFGTPFLLGLHEGLALEAAGLAVRETRGGYHRTELLLKFLKEAETKLS